MSANVSALGGKAKRKAIVARTLRWWDRHRRALVWRAAAGRDARSYRSGCRKCCCSRRRRRRGAYFQAFIAKWPRVEDLAAAPIEAVVGAFAGLGYYSRARSLHACAEIARRGGRFPSQEAELRALPGVGVYTAAAIAAIAFGRQTAPVDGNIARIMARLLALDEPIARARREIGRRRGCWRRLGGGDFAQALMDIGATVCRPRNPDCPSCPLARDCGASGRGARRPIHAASAPRPNRAGRALCSSPAAPTAPFSLAAARRMGFLPRRSSCRARRGPARAGKASWLTRAGRRKLAPAAGDGRTGLHPLCANPDSLRRVV